MKLQLNKVLLVITILIAIGNANSTVSTSCHVYTIPQSNFEKFHNHRFRKFEIVENVNGENIDVCLSLYENSYQQLNMLQLNLLNTNNNLSETSSILFSKRWFDINLRDQNQLCVSYQNLQNLQLTIQLKINLKRYKKNHLVVRDLKVCHSPLQTNSADLFWPPPTRTISTTTTTTTTTPEPTGNWTVPTWPSIETTTDTNGGWTVPTWPTITETSESTPPPTPGNWTVPTWPSENTPAWSVPAWPSN